MINFFPIQLFAQDPDINSNNNIESIENQKEKGITIETIKSYAEVISIFLEVAIIVLLAKTVKDFAELAKVSKLQTEVRFRPWVGPYGGIEFMRNNMDKKQYSIAIKNFGEVPASNVTAYSIISDSAPKKELLSSVKDNNLSIENSRNEKIEKFVMGPLLPGMEKRYWIFLKDEMLKKVKQGTSGLFILFYFSYEYRGGKSGYGMISQFDKNTDTFIHNDMWID